MCAWLRASVCVCVFVCVREREVRKKDVRGVQVKKCVADRVRVRGVGLKKVPERKKTILNDKVKIKKSLKQQKTIFMSKLEPK